MKRHSALLAVLAVVLIGAAIFVFVNRREANLQAAMAQHEAALARSHEQVGQVKEPGTAPTAPAPLLGDGSNHVPGAVPQPAVESAAAQVIVKTQVVAQVEAAKTNAEKVVQDPLSRVALSLVGVDPEAETYWFAAIMNPNLPTSERQDLVDDLNEEGLPDPKNPTVDDLPLLLNRLDILEELVPWIDGNFEWEEPRDDLLNLIARALGGGKPVN
jgi:hypothetical protein